MVLEECESHDGVQSSLNVHGGISSRTTAQMVKSSIKNGLVQLALGIRRFYTKSVSSWLNP